MRCIILLIHRKDTSFSTHFKIICVQKGKPRISSPALGRQRAEVRRCGGAEVRRCNPLPGLSVGVVVISPGRPATTASPLVHPGVSSVLPLPGQKGAPDNHTWDFHGTPPPGQGMAAPDNHTWDFHGAPPPGQGMVALTGWGLNWCQRGHFLPRKGQNRGNPRVDWRRRSRRQSSLGLTDYSKKQPRKRVARSTSGTINALRTLRMRGGAGSGRRGGCRRGRHKIQYGKHDIFWTLY